MMSCLMWTVDNINHNPSSTTSKTSFNGTGVLLFQHPAFSGQGVDRSIAIVGGSARQKTISHLPSYYTEVLPVVSITTKAPIPPSTVETLSRKNSNQNTKEEYCWLENVRKIIEYASVCNDGENSVNQSGDNMSPQGKKSSVQVPYSPYSRRVHTHWQ